VVAKIIEKVLAFGLVVLPASSLVQLSLLSRELMAVTSRI